MSIRLFGLGQKIARIDVSIRPFLATRTGIADRKISDALANNHIPFPVRSNKITALGAPTKCGAALCAATNYLSKLPLSFIQAHV